jgi:hypothetical protein
MWLFILCNHTHVHEVAVLMHKLGSMVLYSVGTITHKFPLQCQCNILLSLWIAKEKDGWQGTLFWNSLSAGKVIRNERLGILQNLSEQIKFYCTHVHSIAHYLSIRHLPFSFLLNELFFKSITLMFSVREHCYQRVLQNRWCGTVISVNSLLCCTDQSNYFIERTLMTIIVLMNCSF